MSNKKTAAFLVLAAAVLLSNASRAGAVPREQLLGAALLQQLDPVVRSAIGGIYREAYPQYGCERIAAINERVTARRVRERAHPVDAMHGARYYAIAVRVCRPKGDQLELWLRNDTVSAQYYLTGYRYLTQAELRAEDGSRQQR
ncbi:hypothetical protein [Paenibacillus methanolicus]|uniref:DUF3888 domain-containing protein n=1 Tax=Paenibacillus methanolicus TaxID=582686 RepID=A0A5S5BTM0_9BACL|nr:hypothetical protein [Paenibacillus methanolicus]TYP69552.1 hypothetical protein BCM02_11468 [Paenibacillus methanolicus]